MITSFLIIVLLGGAVVVVWIAWWLMADLFGRDRMTCMTNSPSGRPQEHIESLTRRERARRLTDDVKWQRVNISSSRAREVEQ